MDSEATFADRRAASRLAGLRARTIEFAVEDPDGGRRYLQKESAWLYGEPAEAPPCHADPSRPEGFPRFLSVLTSRAGALPGPAGLRVRRPSDSAVEGSLQVLEWIDDRQRVELTDADLSEALLQVPSLDDDGTKGGLLMFEMPSPAVQVLSVRPPARGAAGVPSPMRQLFVYAWPRAQHLLVWRRESPSALRLGGLAREPEMRVRFERDGVKLDASDWLRALGAGLEQAIAAAQRALQDLWTHAVEGGVVRTRISPMNGHCALTWGLYSAGGVLDRQPCMRICGETNWRAELAVDLLGTLVFGNVQGRLRLQAQATREVSARVERTEEALAVQEALAPLHIVVRAPLQVEHAPIASPSAAVASVEMTSPAAVVLEAGLQPAERGSGWRWFAKASIEAVELRVHLHDAALGDWWRTLTLMPATVLMDWSAGT